MGLVPEGAIVSSRKISNQCCEEYRFRGQIEMDDVLLKSLNPVAFGFAHHTCVRLSCVRPQRVPIRDGILSMISKMA